MQTPYKGLEPYREDDAEYFFGRDAEIELVCEVLRAARLSIIFGPRGIGKTSLLRAGVVPHLGRTAAQAESVIVFDCAHADPLGRFGAALRSASRERVPNFLSFDSIVKTISSDRKLFILLDQFEECVMKHKAFVAELTRLVGEPDLSMHLLFAVRDEAEFAMQPLLVRLPNVFDGMLRLRPLSDAVARAAIVGPVEVFNSKNPGLEMRIEPEAIEAILTAARDDAAIHIETVKLQRILAALWDYEFSSGVDTLRRSSVEALVAHAATPPAREAEIFDDLRPSTLLTSAEPMPLDVSPNIQSPPEPARANTRRWVTALAVFSVIAAVLLTLDEPDAPLTDPPPSATAPATEETRTAAVPQPDPPLPDSPPSAAAPAADAEKPAPAPEETQIAAAPRSADPASPEKSSAAKPVQKTLAPPSSERQNSESAPPVKQAASKSKIPQTSVARSPKTLPTPRRPASESSAAVSRARSTDVLAEENLPRVFIHVRDKSSATAQLVEALEKNGIAVSGVREVDRGPSNADLRYFRPGEKKEATEIARRLKAFDIKIAEVKYIKGYEAAAPERQYELWLTREQKTEH